MDVKYNTHFAFVETLILFFKLLFGNIRGYLLMPVPLSVLFVLFFLEHKKQALGRRGR